MSNGCAAVLFWRFGPYHAARLSSAGALLRVLGVEACRHDTVYDWAPVRDADNFVRHTLMERCESQHDRRHLRSAMLRTLGELKPGVVAIPGWGFADALSGLSYCVATGTPAVLMSESTECDEQRRPWREAVKRRVVGLCSAGLAGGSAHRDYLKQLGLAQDRVFLGYDAVDNGYFGEGAQEVRRKEIEVRARYGLPQKYFLASARFVEKKNLTRLIEAYARYREKAESGKRKAESAESWDLRQKAESGKLKTENAVIWDLVVLGDGPLRSTLNSQLSTLNLHGHVHLPGFKQYPDLPAYYGLAGAFVHASTTEQWGLVVNEAMASGLPVLVSNRCGCAPDLVQEGVNGFTFDPYDTDRLAQLMLKISAPDFPLAAFGDASRKIIADWGPERFAQGLKAAVDCALAVGPKRATVFDRLLLRLLMMRG